MNLTQRPPRSARVRLGGYVILPRMLDKCRAELESHNGDCTRSDGSERPGRLPMPCCSSPLTPRPLSPANPWKSMAASAPN